ncbi:MAG: sigma-70 family RNA polymerase sigma factor [Phycisphaerae bacterium]|nr:sigma-70 family RNA polymerase sigma factor [Phycisphaerae bacterium]
MADGSADDLRIAVERVARGDDSVAGGSGRGFGRGSGSGTDRAWRTIIERLGPRVFALVRSRCGDAELAEEIAQSVFVTVAEKLPSMTDLSGFESWVFTIALNRLRDEMRRRTRHARPAGDLEALGGTGGDPALSAAPALPSEPDPRIRDLELAMQELSPADREIIDLRHIGGLSFQQMADLLGEPLGTLLSRHHRAVARLRASMERAQKGASPDAIP